MRSVYCHIENILKVVYKAQTCQDIKPAITIKFEEKNLHVFFLLTDGFLKQEA